MNLSDATKLVAILKGVYLREQFTEESPQSFLWLLGDLPLDVVLEAAKIHGMTSKWCPTAAELREVIAKKATPEIASGEAWETVLKQIRKHGYDNFDQCEFGSDAILAAVKSVGWRRICWDDLSNGYVRRDFDVALEAAQQRQRRDVQSGSVDSVSAPKLTALPGKESA